MSGFSQEMFAVYKRNVVGTYDELILDVLENKCIYNDGIEEARLLKNRSDFAEYEVSEDVFVGFATIALEYMECDFTENDVNLDEADDMDEVDEEYERRMASCPYLPLDLVRRGINGEATPEEMRMLCDQENYRMAVGRYWNLEAVERMLHDLEKDKVSVDYFTDWCILMMRCCSAQAERYKHKRRLIMNSISDHFDGIAFMDPEIPSGEKRRECRSILAEMRYVDHCLRYADHREPPPFTYHEGIYIYVNWCAYGKVGEISRICVADHKRRKVNYFYVYNLDFAEKIAYNLLSDRQYEDLFSRYYEYKVDLTIDESYPFKCGR